MVGAGPSGLLLCLLLSKHGIPVHLLEAEDHLDTRPRAAIYSPSAMPDLIRAGVLDEIRRRGMTLDTMSWRKFEDHSEYVRLDWSDAAQAGGVDLRTTCLVLDQLTRLLLDEFLNKYNGTVHWNHKVVTVGQDADQAWVDVETPEGPKRIHGDYVLGCDGAQSQVRKSLFGDDFPGFTWDQQIVATNVRQAILLAWKQANQGYQVYYDFEGKHGWANSNFIIHPDHFTVSITTRYLEVCWHEY